MTADVVWWWRGGREAGEWLPAETRGDADAVALEIERGGRVCVKGLRDIGPPEGPPSEERFREVETQTMPWLKWKHAPASWMGRPGNEGG